MKTLSNIIATFFYLGYSPIMPGTAGTVGAAIVYAALLHWQCAGLLVFLAITIAASIGNIAIGKWAEQHFGTKDPKQVVIDEVAGYFLTVSIFVPSWTVMILGFVMFRIFDISKPYPIKKFEKIGGGLGILVDDLIAGVFAALVLFGLSYIKNPYFSIQVCF